MGRGVPACGLAQDGAWESVGGPALATSVPRRLALPAPLPPPLPPRPRWPLVDVDGFALQALVPPCPQQSVWVLPVMCQAEKSVWWEHFQVLPAKMNNAFYFSEEDLGALVGCVPGAGVGGQCDRVVIRGGGQRMDVSAWEAGSAGH
jgi:hypothetical protein